MIKKIATIDPNNTDDWRMVYKIGKEIKDGPIDIYVTNARPNPALSLQAFLHKVVIKVLAGHIGAHYEEIKTAVELKFCPTIITTLDGETVRVPGKSHKLNMEETENLIKDIRDWADQELDCYIPPYEGTTQRGLEIDYKQNV